MSQANTRCSYQWLQKSPAHESGQLFNVTEALFLLTLETAAPTYAHRVSGTRPEQESPPQPPPGPAGPAPRPPSPPAPGRGPFVRGAAAPRPPQVRAAPAGAPQPREAAPAPRRNRRPDPAAAPPPPPRCSRARAGCGRRSPRSTPVTFRERPPGPGRRFGAPPARPHTPGWGRQAHTASRGRRGGSRIPTLIPGQRREAGTEPPEAPARTAASPTPESSPDAGGAGSFVSPGPSPGGRSGGGFTLIWSGLIWPGPVRPGRAPPSHLRRWCWRRAHRCPLEERAGRGRAREVRPWRRLRAHGRRRARGLGRRAGPAGAGRGGERRRRGRSVVTGCGPTVPAPRAERAVRPRDAQAQCRPRRGVVGWGGTAGPGSRKGAAASVWGVCGTGPGGAPRGRVTGGSAPSPGGSFGYGVVSRLSRRTVTLSLKRQSCFPFLHRLLCFSRNS